MVSGISGISLCWRSSDVICTQFPISVHMRGYHRLISAPHFDLMDKGEVICKIKINNVRFFISVAILKTENKLEMMLRYVKMAVMRVDVRPTNFTTKPRFEIVKLRIFTTMNSQSGLVEKKSHTETVKMQINFAHNVAWG